MLLPQSLGAESAGSSISHNATQTDFLKGFFQSQRGDYKTVFTDWVVLHMISKSNFMCKNQWSAPLIAAAYCYSWLSLIEFVYVSLRGSGRDSLQLQIQDSLTVWQHAVSCVH